MSKYFHKDKPIIGLDISQTSLRIMAINPKKMVVLGYGSVEVDPAKLRQSLDSDGAYLTQQLQKLLNEKIVGKLPSNQVIISIPSQKTYTRTITLPADIKGDLLQAIRLEADQYIPVPADQLYIDYQVTRRGENGIETFMCAAPQHIIDTCLRAARNVQLMPIAVEPSMNAVARLFKISEQGELPTVIVDISNANTDVAVLDKTIKVTGSIDIGGSTFTLDIAKALDVSLERAHQLKVLKGLNASAEQEKLRGALQKKLNSVIEEVRKIMRYYDERVPDSKPIEQVLIIGSGSSIPGIGEYFTETMELASRVASPWQVLNFAKLPQPARQFKPRYISVAGLACVNPKDIWETA